MRADRVWAIFDWDEAGWQSFTSDPDVPAIFQEAGFHTGSAQVGGVPPRARRLASRARIGRTDMTARA